MSVTEVPLVSVIIPAYNGDRYITQAIESVLNQTYSHAEIIVIDDGSQDCTPQVLKPYQHCIQYVYQKNQGVGSARNRGLEMARGEFIAFLDQDDVCLNEKLALQVDCMERQPEIGMVHSGWRIVDQDGQHLGDVEPWHQAPTLDLPTWILQMPAFLSAMLFRRFWLRQAQGFDTSFRQAGDVDLLQRLALLGCQTAWLPQVTVWYRQHGQNDSLNTRLQTEEAWSVRDHFFKRSDLPEAIRQLEPRCRYNTLVWSAWRLYLTGYLLEMVQCLEKSLTYTPYLRTETVLDWVTCFSNYSAAYGQTLDLATLTALPGWQQLLIRTVL
ncbi:glycosyl transferase [Neosynechococcus sphagnicola sy1]|uniref:Glycosyl transferase n=1 Tax=Neosynechococcus sphagnicola sy1 TaxID=1497020 RepID=A0A098TIZ5_9CYAN|nr:glycosyltransferase [Neosynechococcus sphagnicola]KGF72016.1 glycosyl transferase [Neosynechococcus sphagnicola sy1]